MLVMPVNLYDAKTRLSELVEVAHEGEVVIIAKGGRPLATLGPLPASKRRIRLGRLKGKIKVARDFDAALPDHVIDAFEGRPKR